MAHTYIFFKSSPLWYFWEERCIKGIWHPWAPFCSKPSPKIPEILMWGPGNLHFQSLANDSEAESDYEPQKYKAGSFGDPICDPILMLWQLGLLSFS